MLKLLTAGALIAMTVFASGCAYSPVFGFPAEQSDAEAGRQAFIDHQCHRCHSVAGVRFPPIAGASAPVLELGGDTIYVKSYADLMTSIINPNHRISERYRDQEILRGNVPVDSPMPMPYIDNMTVRQLIDIVAFLDSRYELIDGYDAMD